MGVRVWMKIGVRVWVELGLGVRTRIWGSRLDEDGV